MPAGPGLSHGSPSSVNPWTAIAISAVSAVCSWIAFRMRGSPGFFVTRPESASPRPTEMVISASAIRPEARLASHQA